ncbi:MAG: GspH/FimT family pseudopilin [Acidobacteriota bacterium]
MKVPLPTPATPRSANPDEGFTLIEVLIVILIVGTLALVGIPNLLLMLERSKVSSALRESTNVLQVARQEAIRRGVDVVVLADTTNNRLFAFANVDDDAGLLYQPNATAVARTVDYRVSESGLPQGRNDSTSIKFWGPADAAPNGTDIADGLNTDSSSRPVAVFEPDGSVRETGAFRIADARGNFFEIRVEPRATARVEVRKYYPTPPFASGTSGFYPRGKDATSGANLWKWF